MKLKDPKQVRLLFAEKKGWYTLQEIADGTKQGVNTVARGLSGKNMRPKTVKDLAAALEVKPLEIAEFVN